MRWLFRKLLKPVTVPPSRIRIFCHGLHYRKQIELLLIWAKVTTRPHLKVQLLERAIEFLTLANCTDDEELLRVLREALDGFHAHRMSKP